MRKDLLSSSTYLRSPPHIFWSNLDNMTNYNQFFDVNLNDMMPFIKHNLSELIQISVERSPNRNGGLQPCISYKPPGPSPGEGTYDKSVCML